MVDVVLADDGVYDLDVSGYLCPFPVLKAAKVLRELDMGSCLRVWSTDVGSWDDFKNFADGDVCELLGREKKDDGVFEFLLRRC